MAEHEVNGRSAADDSETFSINVSKRVWITEELYRLHCDLQREQFVTSRVLAQIQSHQPTPHVVGFLRVWELLAYMFPPRVRKRVYAPAINDLICDYVESRRLASSGASRCWLRSCFLFRTVILVVDGLRAMCIDKLICFVARIAPGPLRDWWLMK